MMTAAFGEESATGSSIMSPSGGIILSQVSAEKVLFSSTNRVQSSFTPLFFN